MRVVQVVHEANADNLRLKEMLLMRDNRIDELETEVEALNKVGDQIIFRDTAALSDQFNFSPLEAVAKHCFIKNVSISVTHSSILIISNVVRYVVLPFKVKQSK